ncbi:MAG: MBL fold metallo-hydrolase [Planctomycetota bacterium]
MQVTILGSGTALPTARRSSSGYLVEWHGGALLLDPSAGTYARALKAGLDPYVLGAVLLTHFHLDHTADLPAILWARRQMEDLESTLLVAGPVGTKDHLARLVQAHGKQLDASCEATGYPFELAGLFVEAFPAEHPGEAVCLRLTADGRTLAYSGDTADCAGLRKACRAVDLALLECTSATRLDGHLTPEDCESVCKAAEPRRVLLTHLGPDVEASYPSAEDGLVAAV